MKSNLMLKKFITNTVPGTMNQKELKTFFGGKVLYSEDYIYINDDTINYSEAVSSYNNGYQYFDVNTIQEDWESEFAENLTDLKANNQSILLLNQTNENLSNNTRWQITINGTSILRDYLFARLKERRVFKMINAIDVYSNDINTAVYDYIDKNLIGRYRLLRVDFYVSYYDIKQQQSIYNKILLQYDPTFDVSVYSKTNLTNANIVGYDPYKFNSIVIQYNQSKSSSQYSFNYYFDLVFTSVSYRKSLVIGSPQTATTAATTQTAITS
jgi:hypothetical protein